MISPPGLRTLFLHGLCFLAAEVAARGTDQKPLVRKGSPLTDDFKKLVLKTLDEWHIPGLSIAVIDGDDIWTEGYGIASFPSEPVTPDTLFYCASTTKAHTATALALMIDSGNYSTPPAPLTSSYGRGAPSSAAGSGPVPLGWRTPLAAIMGDDFVLEDAWATAHLTLEDALSHRSGLPRHDKALARFYPDEQSQGQGQGRVSSKEKRHPATVRDVVRSLRYLPLSAEPRTTFQYCNLMFAVASHAVETLLGGKGHWLGDFLRERLWEPLGMRATYFSLEDALAAPQHFAHGYGWDERKGEFREAPYMALQEVSGAGAVVSNAKDYAKWVRFLMREEAPLSKEGHRAIKTPKVFASAEAGPFDTPPTYASGLASTSYRGHRFFEHAGGMHAYGAEVYFFPDDDFGVVTFANTAITSNAVGEILIWHLVDEKLGIPKDKRHDWTKSMRKEKWQDAIRGIQARIDTAVETLYPNVSSKNALPPALPLERYAGTYFHPGYQSVTLEVAHAQSGGGKTEHRLAANRTDFTWEEVMDFRHVSGEYWIVYSELAYAVGSHQLREYAAVEFRLTPAGQVGQLGIEFRDLGSQVVDGWIWFDKLD